MNLELEKQYSPSYYSHRFVNMDEEEMLTIFSKIGIEESDRARQLYNTRLNVRYGDTERQAVDIYFKDKESDKPIFVFIHGGYWYRLDKKESAFCVAPLVEKGYRVVIMDHDLCPTVTLKEVVQQMKKFLQFLLQYATETNAPSISLSGHCAGAHLITSLLKQDLFNLPNFNLIKNFFLFAGIYDLREMRKTEVANPNGILSLNEESAEKLSPFLFEFPESAKSDGLEICFIIGEHDTPTFHQQSREFSEKLERSGFRANFNMLKGYDHFTLIQELRCKESAIIGLIMKKLGLN